jgi:hypothetical protein
MFQQIGWSYQVIKEAITIRRLKVEQTTIEN